MRDGMIAMAPPGDRHEALESLNKEYGETISLQQWYQCVDKAVGIRVGGTRMPDRPDLCWEKTGPGDGGVGDAPVGGRDEAGEGDGVGGRDEETTPQAAEGGGSEGTQGALGSGGGGGETESDINADEDDGE
ncbi:unnamed protein product [Ectocarpus sp. 8 AP-2014]